MVNEQPLGFAMTRMVVPVHPPRAAAPSRAWRALFRWPLLVFQFPGNLVADRIHAVAEDDRMMICTLIDMLVWNVVVVVTAWIVFTHVG